MASYSARQNVIYYETYKSFLDRILEDHSGYYLIAYEPDVSTFKGRATFHKLKVEVSQISGYETGTGGQHDRLAAATQLLGHFLVARRDALGDRGHEHDHIGFLGTPP